MYRYLLLLITLFNTSVAASNAATLKCNDRIAQAPINVNDPDYGRWLLELARTHMLAEDKLTCDPFIDFEKSVASFDYIGVSFYFGKASNQYTDKQIRLIRYNFQASHIMLTDMIDDFTLRVSLFRIEGKTNFVLKRLRQYDVTIPKNEAKKHQTSVFLKYLSLISPNSFTIGSTQTRVVMELDENYSEYDTIQKSVIPKIVSSVSFNKIDNSYAYNMFDASGSLFPGQFFFGLDQITKIRKKDTQFSIDEETETLHVSIYGTCPNINALGTLHTPIGATYISAGVGPCILHKRIEDEKAKLDIDLAYRFVLGHRVFFTKKYFTFLEVDTLYFQRRLYESEHAKSSTISRATLGLGMYVADAESRFLSIFQAIGL